MSESELIKSTKGEVDWRQSVREVSQLSSRQIHSDLSDVSKLESKAKFVKIESYELESLTSKNDGQQIYQDNYSLDDHLTEQSLNSHPNDNSNKKCNDFHSYITFYLKNM